MDEEDTLEVLFEAATSLAQAKVPCSITSGKTAECEGLPRDARCDVLSREDWPNSSVRTSSRSNVAARFVNSNTYSALPRTPVPQLLF